MSDEVAQILAEMAGAMPSPAGDGARPAAGAGRVPDGIRLRATRGAQGADTWYVVRLDRDEYVDRARGVAAVAGLEAVGGPALVQQVEAWPWGEPAGPDPRALLPPAPWAAWSLAQYTNGADGPRDTAIFPRRTPGFARQAQDRSCFLGTAEDVAAWW